MTGTAAQAGLLPIHVALLCALLFAAATSDAVWRRVPNALPVAVAVLGGIARASVAGPRAALVGYAAAALLLAVLAIPWSFRLLGGGDVKLAAACAAWLGFGRLPAFLLAASLAGGIVSLVAFARTWRSLASAGAAEWREGASKTRVPYSPAIAAGALASIFWSFP